MLCIFKIREGNSVWQESKFEGKLKLLLPAMNLLTIAFTAVIIGSNWTMAYE